MAQSLMTGEQSNLVEFQKKKKKLTLWRGARRGREKGLHVQLHKHKGGGALCTTSTRGSDSEQQQEKGEQPAAMAAMAAGRRSSHGGTGLALWWFVSVEWSYRLGELHLSRLVIVCVYI